MRALVSSLVVLVSACSSSDEHSPSHGPNVDCYRALGAEVMAMFAELRTKEENVMLEQGAYSALGPYRGGPLPRDWAALRFEPPQARLTCTYAVVVDERAGAPYAAIADCDAAGLPVRFATSSRDPQTYSFPDEATIARRTCPRPR